VTKSQWNRQFLIVTYMERNACRQLFIFCSILHQLYMQIRFPTYYTWFTLYPQKLAITSPTSGSRSVGVVRSRTQTMELVLLLLLAHPLGLPSLQDKTVYIPVPVQRFYLILKQKHLAYMHRAALLYNLKTSANSSNCHRNCRREQCF
jgi:hypothetical protein